MTSPVADYAIGLGSNLGSRLGYLQAAVELLEQGGLAVVARSSVWPSAPVGPSQPDYLNAAIAVQSALSPRALLARLLEVERALGRERVERWGARTIDLDILWGTIEVDEPDLHVPHAELTRRWFALAPLLEVVPSLSQRYAGVLRGLGPLPAVRGAFTLEPGARVARTTGQLRVQASGDCAEDAASSALTALGRALAVAGAAVDDGSPRVLGAGAWLELVEAALQLARDGRAWRRALVHVADGARYSARLLGATESGERPRLLEAEHAPGAPSASIALAP